MFQRLTKAGGRAVHVVIDGVAVAVRETDTVAAAMLAAGCAACRASLVSSQPRGPYCLMGVCFDCLVTIDGIANRQGCMTMVREGMRIETLRGRRELGR